MSKNRKIILVSVLILLIISTWVAIDVYNNIKIEKLPAKPLESMISDASSVLWALENNVEPDYSIIVETCDFIDARYDKADFAISTLIRIMYSHGDKLPKDIKTRMKTTFLDFKYWMDQPGEDSICYWSENHQILFASSEYLVGQLYPNEIFMNDSKTGLQHMKEAEMRVSIWLEQRWLYGFSEWYSNNYYKEDLMALSQLMDFSANNDIHVKSQIITDLLFYDVASQSYKGTFVSTSGRLYEDNKKSGLGNRLNRIEESLWGFDLEAKESMKGLDLNFLFCKNYVIPKVISEIGFDTENVIIKASNGLNLTELKSEDLLGQEDKQIMMQWTMEGFTNPEVINNSLAYIDANDMFSNEFLYDFSLMNIDLVKGTFVLPAISKHMNLVTNGVALQRANTYTYKTGNYMLATAQRYHPGTFGDQQHIWSATLSNEISVFTTHPAASLESKGSLTGSPNYWVGSGRLPDAVQSENINMCLYILPDKKGLMEDELLYYTHAYFPKNKMDQTVIDGSYIFGQSGDTYIAMIGKNKLAYREGSHEDVIQMGQDTFWITELSEAKTESFEGFMERIINNELSYDEINKQLVYQSKDQIINLTYQGVFLVNDSPIDTEYKRFDSPYSETDRQDKTIILSHNQERLLLDFYGNIRLESTGE